MVPFINQVLHAILRGLAVGTAVMHRSLRNLDVRVWGTSQAWDVQEKTSLETCRRCPSHRDQMRGRVIAIGLAITQLLISAVV